MESSAASKSTRPPPPPSSTSSVPTTIRPSLHELATHPPPTADVNPFCWLSSLHDLLLHPTHPDSGSKKQVTLRTETEAEEEDQLRESSLHAITSPLIYLSTMIPVEDTAGRNTLQQTFTLWVEAVGVRDAVLYVCSALSSMPSSSSSSSSSSAMDSLPVISLVLRGLLPKIQSFPSGKRRQGALADIFGSITTLLERAHSSQQIAHDLADAEAFEANQEHEEGGVGKQILSSPSTLTSHGKNCPSRFVAESIISDISRFCSSVAGCAPEEISTIRAVLCSLILFPSFCTVPECVSRSATIISSISGIPDLAHVGALSVTVMTQLLPLGDFDLDNNSTSHSSSSTPMMTSNALIGECFLALESSVSLISSCSTQLLFPCLVLSSAIIFAGGTIPDIIPPTTLTIIQQLLDTHPDGKSSTAGLNSETKLFSMALFLWSLRCPPPQRLASVALFRSLFKSISPVARLDLLVFLLARSQGSVPGFSEFLSRIAVGEILAATSSSPSPSPSRTSASVPVFASARVSSELLPLFLTPFAAGAMGPLADQANSLLASLSLLRFVALRQNLFKDLTLLPSASRVAAIQLVDRIRKRLLTETNAQQPQIHSEGEEEDIMKMEEHESFSRDLLLSELESTLRVLS